MGCQRECRQRSAGQAFKFHSPTALPSSLEFIPFESCTFFLKTSHRDPAGSCANAQHSAMLIRTRFVIVSWFAMGVFAPFVKDREGLKGALMHSGCLLVSRPLWSRCCRSILFRSKRFCGLKLCPILRIWFYQD